MPATFIRDIFHQLLLGLAAAHDAGLIHRDIKSSNLLLDCGLQIADCGSGPTRTLPSPITKPSITNLQSSIPNPQSPIVKIADFGLARMLTAQTRLTLPDSTPGTPEYMSPEQARGDEDLDQRTDLYSAGVVLYEMLTGRTPFPADTPTAVLHRILHEAPADPRTICKHTNPHLATLALRLMAKRPEDRFASASEAISVLEAGQHVRSLERGRRRCRYALLGAAAIVLLGGITCVLGQFAGRPPITQVWVDYGDEEMRTTVLARRGDDPSSEVFYRFPPQVSRVFVPGLVDLDGTGGQAIVVGLEVPFRGLNLFAFDLDGKELWKKYLSSTVIWPDCGTAGPWSCASMVAADLDGEPGEEVLVLAHHQHEYAACLFIIDPRTGEIRSAFWHMGHFMEVRIQPDFFGPQRPALIAWAYHNKLDGFEDPLPGDAKPLTNQRVVTAAMILDPADMDGLGPPLTDQQQLRDLAPAGPFAYAFLNTALPGGSNGADAPTVGLDPDKPEVACISKIYPIVAPPERDGAECLRVAITPPGGVPGWHLVVDRNLTLLKVLRTGDQTRHGKLADWDLLWRPIIQHGEYVEE